MNEKQKELLDTDLYALFDVEEGATVEQIKKAYRRKALELHPDKNLDNKEEAEKKFVQLGKAFEVLTDPAAKNAYDAVRRNRREQAARLEKLDAKRRKFKDDLEARERSDFKPASQKDDSEEKFRREIERLRKEGSKLLEQEMNFVSETLKEQKMHDGRKEEGKKSAKETHGRVKASWSAKNEMAQDLLEHLFGKYGHIELVIMGEKKTSAIVEFKAMKDAVKAYKDAKALEDRYGVKLKWLGDKEDLDQVQTGTENGASRKSPCSDEPEQSKESTPQFSNSEFSHLSFDDMEAAILRKLQTKS